MSIFNYLNLRTELESIIGTDGTIDNIQNFLKGGFGSYLRQADRTRATTIAKAILEG